MGFLTQKKSVNLYVCIVHYFALIKVKSLVRLLQNGKWNVRTQGAATQEHKEWGGVG